MQAHPAMLHPQVKDLVPALGMETLHEQGQIDEMRFVNMLSV